MFNMKRQIKDHIYLSISVFTKALSSPKRIEMMELLLQGEKTVEMISEQSGFGLKNTSAQLKELKSAGLVNNRKEGKFVFYFIDDVTVIDFLIILRKFSEKKSFELQNIIEKHLTNPDDLQGYDRKSILQKAKRGDVLIIDVRPIDEYESGHLSYAISVPLSELGKKLKTFSKNIEIVAYCRGPYCFLANEAVQLLKKNGFMARRLSDGIQDWKRAGFPISN